MVYLIKSQLNRRVEEILYDYNYENLQDPIDNPWKYKYSKTQISYRRREIKLQKNFKLVIILFCVGYWLDVAVAFKTNLSVAFYIFALMYLVFTVYLTFYFTILCYLMRRYHHFEFQQHK